MKLSAGLREMLCSASAKRQETALERIAERNNPVPLKMLLPFLHARSSFLRDAALKCLARHPWRRVAPLILEALRDPEEIVRITASEELFFRPLSERERETLLRLFNRSRSGLVRRNLLVALARKNDPSFRDFLKRKLRIIRTPQVRAGILAALICSGERAFLKEFLHILLLRTADYRVRCFLANTLETDLLPLSDKEKKRAAPEIEKALAAHPPESAAIREALSNVLRRIRA